MRVNLGKWNPLLEGWVLCTHDQCEKDCIACIRLPPDYTPTRPQQVEYALTYLAARHLLDHNIAAALHAMFLQDPRSYPGPQALAKLLRGSKVESPLPPRLEPQVPAWKYVLWRGIAEAQLLLTTRPPPRGRLGGERE